MSQFTGKVALITGASRGIGSQADLEQPEEIRTGHHRVDREAADRYAGGHRARMIASPCSDDAEWIVGQTIMVDGGMTILSPYPELPGKRA